MIHLDFSDKRPLYEQIKDKLRELILSGAVKQGEKIPSVRELAASLAINPNTIQHAYKELEEEGYIYSLRAKGSFVSPCTDAMLDKNRDVLFKNLQDAAAALFYHGAQYEDVIEEIMHVYESVRKDGKP